MVKVVAGDLPGRDDPADIGVVERVRVSPPEKLEMLANQPHTPATRAVVIGNALTGCQLGSSSRTGPTLAHRSCPASSGHPSRPALACAF